MTLRKLFHHSGRYVFLLLIFLLPFLRNVSYSAYIGNNVVAYFVVNFGGIYPTESVDIMTIVFYIVPNLIMIYVFSDIMREDCLINYVYVLTRNEKKQKWLFQKAFQLFLKVLIAYVLLYVLAFIIAGTAKLEFYGSGFDSVATFTVIFLLNVLSMFFIIYLQNFLSLYYGGAQSFVCVLLLYIISMGVALIFYNSSSVSNVILELLVPTNQMYIWHADCYHVQGAENWLDNPLKGFHIISSFIILSLYIILEYWFSRHIFISRDTMKLMKEA